MHGNSAAMRTDSAQLEIFVQRFRSITEEMGFAVQRTGHTAFVNETADLGVALVTPEGEIFGYPQSIGITMFANLNFASILSEFDAFEPGDIVVCNDPYSSGGLSSHLPDVSVLAPIFSGERLVCFAYSYVHSTDIGGRVAGSLSPSSYEIYQEGIRIPPTRLYKAGELNADVLKLILCNCRVPDDNWGDVKAMITALRVAERRIGESVDKYGVDTFVDAMNDVLNYSELRARSVIETIPDGVYRFSDYLDDDVVSDIPVKFCVALTVAGDAITVDFTGTDSQLRSAFNIYSEGKPHPWLIYKIMFVLLTMDQGIPVNAGLLRPVSVVAPRGSLVNCEPPAAVGLRTTTGVRIQDAICGALAQAVPNVIPAAGAGYIAPIVFAEPNLERGGLKVNVLEPMVGGTGGHEGGDGLNARDVVDIANLRNSPVEVVENVSGVRILNYSLRQDSGGAGKFRGGLGLVFEFEVLEHNCLVTARGQERHRFRPWGLNGGFCGEKAAVFIKRAGDDRFNPIPKIDSLEVDAGDVVRILTPGGGGFGSPLDRDPQSVLRDVRNDMISIEAARNCYGVLIGSETVDVEATADLRARMKSDALHEAFSFGPERQTYDAVWTDDAWLRLMSHVQAVPVALRSSLRGRVWRAAQRLHEAEKKPLSALDIDACWAKITGKSISMKVETVLRRDVDETSCA
ncbi:hydantoinase B/oxoprolinase family protein [Amorphus sp. 3PC139-8]|uniref:hydantoinase B/oxoprolinase family protein n=1 Tax=Amorphus sp. 3PC139-8 TaxID=2735676 RepID=UPI00345C855B